jgi:NADPH:quinone reductase-like Zn-dependent oxidoreductase
LSLLQVGKLQAGQRVLIHAAAGGVGSFAVQFARQAGAHVVATASARNHDLLRTLGADEVIDYRSEDFSARLRGVDLVLDTVGGETLERSWRVLRPGGTIVSTVEFAVQPPGDAHGVFAFFRQDAEVLRSIIGRFAEGRLQVVLDTLHTLDDARAALERAASGHARGKLVLRV